MNNSIEFNQKRFLILLLGICLVFFILIIKAFEYVPAKVTPENRIVSNINDINKPTEHLNNIDNKEIDDNTDSTQEIVEKIQIDTPPTFEEIKEKNVIVETPQIQPETIISTKIEDIMKEATQEIDNSNYAKAIELYQLVPSLTTDNETVAKSYEEKAKIYATMKKFGSALASAQKAYNIAPNDSRNLLIAKIYYKSGDTQKATNKINTMLQKDFR